jgi:hypothetical protein
MRTVSDIAAGTKPPGTSNTRASAGCPESVAAAVPGWSDSRPAPPRTTSP